MPKIFIHTRSTADHRLDFNKNDPATDAERRSRIQEVVRNVGCTSAVALRWLEAEEWIVDTTVRELKHSLKLGFVVDSKMTDKVRDAESDLDRQVRTAYKNLTDEFAAQGEYTSRGTKAARSEFIAINYKYKKDTGQWHPLAREMD